MESKNLEIDEKYLDRDNDITVSDNDSIEVIDPERAETDEGISICPASREDD